MKKYFIFAAAAIVAASCAKTPAPVQTPDGPEAPAVEGKVAVQFGTNVSASVETKSEGSVDAWNGQQKLYIYGLKRIQFKTAEPESQTITKNLYKTPFIANVSADSPSTPSESNAIKVLQENNEPYYYDGNSTYDFFGYYVDEADATTGGIKLIPNATQGDKIDSAYVLPIIIDGGQDILLAKASADYAFNKLTPANKNKYWTTDGTEWAEGNSTWKEKYAFSAYAARREVHPYLVFEHQLTQIQFYVTSGTQFTHTEEEQVKVDAPALSVTDVTFSNVATKANLYVASGKIPEGLYDAVVDDATKDIAVTKATASDDPTRTALTPVLVPNKDAGAEQIGAPTMLIPAAEYSVVIKLSQAAVGGGAAATQTIERTLKISDVLVKVADGDGKQPGTPGYTETWKKASELGQTLFTAGYRYNVNIKVYGLESVDITAELAPWKDGGKIDIDTDEEPEF